MPKRPTGGCSDLLPPRILSSYNRKGCYNCSQRRIKCDLSRPKCNKCLRKGLECPGYGIRYRFNNGLASRGKLTGRTVPVENAAEVPRQPDQSRAPSLLWPDGSVTQTEALEARREEPSSTWPQDLAAASSTHLIIGDAHSPSNIVEIGEFGHEFAIDHDVDFFQDEPNFAPVSAACDACQSIHPSGMCDWEVPKSLEIIGPQSRELFSHFSSSVAPVMVVLDGKFNGYRDLVLPLACQDDLVKNAVSVVSMYHLAAMRPEMQSYADSGLQAIIRQLLKRTSLQGEALDISAWTTIIVLLVGETVTGGNNLPYLFRILQHLSEANTKSGQESVMHSFLREQTRMMTLFAQPLLGEAAGTMTLRTPPDVYFDFISNAAIFHPGLATQIDLYKSSIRQACNIYLRRVTQNPPHSDTVADLEDLKAMCERIHPNTPGHHTLVWVYFVAAAESWTLAHREFFTQRLQQVYSCTRFHNIPTALAGLQELWKVQDERRWTEILPEVMPVFII